MNSGEIIGISIVAVVAIIIIIIYACKCYSDYSLGHHEENVKPINVGNDQELALISAECTNPMPHDPYIAVADIGLADKDYNDLEMVSLSIEQFIRKENYRKSMTNNQKNYKKLGRRVNSSSSTGIEEDLGNIEYHGISDHKEEIDGRLPPSVKSPVANANGYHHTSKAVDAPVIVHHSLGHPKSQVQENQQPQDLYEHIYAPVERSNPAPSAPSLTAPTYFRPVKAAASENLPNKPDPPSDVAKDLSSEITLKSEMQPMSTEIISEMPALNSGPNQETKSEIVKPTSVGKSKRAAQKSIENVPPNEQETTEENLFFIPEEVVSPKTPKKNRRKTERTVKTLDDLGVTSEKPKTKKSKKVNGKGEGAPKAQKRRKKSVPELDIAKPVKVTDIEHKTVAPKNSQSEAADSIGLKSPPIPPKPKFNPLLSPTVQTRNEGNARISQL